MHIEFQNQLLSNKHANNIYAWPDNKKKNEGISLLLKGYIRNFG